MQPSLNPFDQQPTWKQCVQRLIASMSLVAALTAALIAITPLLMGHPDWLQILFTFALVLFFAILHSLTATIPDPALRVALSAVLDKLETILQQLANVSSRLASVEQTKGTETTFGIQAVNPNDDPRYHRS